MRNEKTKRKRNAVFFYGLYRARRRVWRFCFFKYMRGAHHTSHCEACRKFSDESLASHLVYKNSLTSLGDGKVPCFPRCINKLNQLVSLFFFFNQLLALLQAGSYREICCIASCNIRYWKNSRRGKKTHFNQRFPCFAFMLKTTCNAPGIVNAGIPHDI